ncbi:MAG: LysM peptidoglycan-binding domain-containing protein [Luteitalea sp.]|nr:LysM peptidoglycan-binding domain-containing protein [Luteitalea sp.]
MTDSTRHHLPMRRTRGVRGCTTLALALVLLGSEGRVARAETLPDLLPLEDVSPMFLGMYRKVMVIEAEIKRYSEQYGVDFDLARAVCLYESGGNAELHSGAGAQGYFQVMPRTFRTLGVQSNIEAGVKYLSQMIRRFEREDRAVAAYNGGPTRVGRGGPLPLETLQYVLGVGHYRTVLKQHDASLRHHAEGVHLTTVHADEDWPALSSRLGVPEWELRLHNAFLAQRRPRPGQLIAYPAEPRSDLFRAVNGDAEYRIRYGDNYLNLAFTLGIDPDALRHANGLWQIQSVPAGVSVRIPLSADRSFLLRAALGLTPTNAPEEAAVVRTVLAPPSVPVVPAMTRRPSPPPSSVIHRVARGDTLARLARRYGTTIRALQEANGLAGRTTIRVGQRLQVLGPAGIQSSGRAFQEPRRTTHRVSRGETLAGLANKYGTTIAAIQQANGMARRTTIRTGERLHIPGDPGI